jgi:hypothetical protein
MFAASSKPSSEFNYILGFVIMVHLALLLWTGLAFERRPILSPRSRLLVKTIELKPIVKTQEPILNSVEQGIKAKEPSSSKTASIEPKKPPLKAKKEVVQKISPPKPRLQPAVEPKSFSNAKVQALLAKAQENIAKIQKENDKNSADAKLISANLPVPQWKETDNKDEPQQQTNSYHDELINRLQLLLCLPDYGEVKIKLTLRRSGEFKKVEFIEAKSTKNRKYVEKMVPTLTYPPFGDHFTAAQEYTFIIRLCNK